MAAADLATGHPSTLARSEVRQGERLVWADRAVRRRPGSASLIVVLFGLAFAGFGVLWMLIAYGSTEGNDGPWRYFPLFGVPFVAIGLIIATVPVWLRLIGGATVYALTDQRVLMLHGRRNRMVRSTGLDAIGDLLVTEEADGTGSIMFGGMLDLEAAKRADRVGGIYGVPNIRRVRGMIEREIARAAAGGAAKDETAA